MDQQLKTRRFGIYVILCACIFRLSMMGLPFRIESETGRNVRFSSSLEKNMGHFRESPGPWLPEGLRFSAEDLEVVKMDYDCALRPDLEELLLRPLDWDLRGEAPAVLILHTHTTESYTKAGEQYRESSAYRTLEEEYNMVSIGDAVAEILQERGIGVIHDREVHDYPSYNGSYVHARKSTQMLLEQYPSIRLVLDLHRDALEQEGRQLRTTAETAGEPSAQLMLVVGTNVSRQSHENWQENLALALKLQVQLQRMAPGIMRPVNLRQQRFNQDLSPGALIVEVGAAGNTRQEALRAAKQLAEGVASLAMGTRQDTTETGMGRG